VQLSALRHDGQWGFQVKDTGPGIPPEAQERIFQAFEQVSNGYVGSAKGVGLGLSIVKELTVLMDGRVTVESTVGQGSTFTVMLPLQVSEEEAV